MHLAKNALEWAVYEMEQRYEAMARTGVRHITTYNQKLAEMGDDRPEDMRDLKPFPYLIIVVDELADMMMTAAKEVEGSIVRLAQLARASGIHLILATQRPSVDVVTGIIKANFPSRIAFQVSSKHDSRTILDGIGAEYLLGHGDMLFKLSGGNVQRVHGAFVGDDEIARVVKYWETQRPQRFELDFAEWNTAGESGGEGNGGSSDVLDDPKYAEAIDFVSDQGRASISMIQRRLRIGFNRAARFIEQMEMDGIIGPQDGSKPRLVRKKD
jgi:S-DNA-T family DNA segregation ATPase FtsK/SpoIIIE